MEIRIKCDNEIQAVAIANFLEDMDNLKTIRLGCALPVDFHKTDVNYDNKDVVLINIE